MERMSFLSINQQCKSTQRKQLTAAAAAVDRYLLLTGPTAANSPHAAAAGEWDRQIDRHRTITYTARSVRRCQE